MKKVFFSNGTHRLLQILELKEEFRAKINKIQLMTLNYLSFFKGFSHFVLVMGFSYEHYSIILIHWYNTHKSNTDEKRILTLLDNFPKSIASDSDIPRCLKTKKLSVSSKKP